MVTLTQPTVTTQTVLSLDLSAYARPETLKLGFASGSGGQTNYHEIRNVSLTAIAAREWDGAAVTDNGVPQRIGIQTRCLPTEQTYFLRRNPRPRRQWMYKPLELSVP